MLKIAVLDDDSEILSKYKTFIPTLFDKHNIDGDLVLATSDHNKLIKEIASNKVNVCILDINLANSTNGMYIAQKIRQEGFEIEIIFVTGCLDFIRQAFDVRAYQFIYKPGWDELENTLLKLAHEKELENQPYVKLKCNSEIYFIPKSDINSVERLKSKTVVRSAKGDFSTYEGLEELVSRINDGRFKRCHRSVFVNTKKIYCIDLKKKIIKLQDGSSCDIGPKFFCDFYEEGQQII